MKVLIALLVIVLFFLVLMFCIENMDQQVTVHFLQYHSPPMPVFAVALAAALAGVVFTGMVTLAEGIRLRVRNLRMSRRIKKLESEIDSLRSLALGPTATPEATEEPSASPPPPSP